ncbi:MAG: Gfo/Idh/MocA family oxidoreductase, partial [Pseudolabrys sp.]
YFKSAGRGTKARDVGGVLLTQAIHTLDLLLHLVGPHRDVAGFAMTSPLRAIDTEDIAAAAIRFKNGAIGAIDATTVARPGYPERIELAGTKGSAVLETFQLTINRASGATEIVGSAQSGGGGGRSDGFRSRPAQSCDYRNAQRHRAKARAIEHGAFRPARAAAYRGHLIRRRQTRLKPA